MSIKLLKPAEFIPLQEVRSLVGRPLQLSVPEGEINREGVRQILEYLSEAYPGVQLPSEQTNEFFSWIWLDTKQGTLPKRMGKWLKKRLGMHPDQKVIAHVGNLGRQNSDTSQTYYFRIVDKIDWDASHFGKTGGGCWWGASGGDRKSGKPEKNSYVNRFTQNDGLGVQFFQDDSYLVANGIGRIWLYIDPDYRFATTFNGYWANEGATLRLTRVLASYLGLSYQKCDSLSAEFSVYVNDGTGYYIGDQLILNSRKHESYTMPRKIIRKPCSRCQAVTEESVLDRYEMMCQTCYNLTRRYCNFCLRYEDSSRFAQVRTNTGLTDWCGDCVANYALSCRGCRIAYVSRYFDYPGCVKVDDYYMCTKCTMSSRKCQDCGKRTLNTDAADDALCLSCEDAFEEEIQIERDGDGEVVLINDDGSPQWLGQVPRIEVMFDSERLRQAVEHSNAAMRRLRETLANGESDLVRRIRNTVMQETQNEDPDIPF